MTSSSVELPSYVGAITAFRNVGAAMVGVEQDRDGINLDDLRVVTARVRREGKRIKALYVVPNFQNPTGLLMSLAKRRAVLEWANVEDVLIIEDDPYRDSGISRIRRLMPTRVRFARMTRGRPGYLLEQLLQDPRAGVPRRLGERAPTACRQSRNGETGRRSVLRLARSTRGL